MLIDGAVEHVPASLVSQLADRGRMALVRIDGQGVGRASLGRRAGAAFGIREFADAPAVERVPGFDRPAGFSF